HRDPRPRPSRGSRAMPCAGPPRPASRPCHPPCLSGVDTMTEHLPPSLADIEELARGALDTIPHELKAHVGPVVIRVEEFPDEETEEAMGLDGPFDILGLYRGVALPHKSVGD